MEVDGMAFGEDQLFLYGVGFHVQSMSDVSAMVAFGPRFLGFSVGLMYPSLIQLVDNP